MPARLARPLLALALLLALAGQASAQGDAVARGEYLTRAGGCFSCHTAASGQPLAGGRALATPFGTFYSPNITPDRQTGIGAWTDAQFLRALRQGIRPDGSYFFPVFPYTSFTNITDADALAIKAYLFSRPAVHQPDRPHDVRAPFSWRFLQAGWRWLYFTPGPFRPAPNRDAVTNRGAYLVTALAHCGECHTPRNWLGAMRADMKLAGNTDGPDGDVAANITPDPKTGIGGWSVGDIAEVLKTGSTPDETTVKGSMKEAVEDGLKYLTDADRRAIATYILAQPPIVHDVEK
jgi:mono/diheme cytochrome c family protein